MSQGHQHQQIQSVDGQQLSQISLHQHHHVAFTLNFSGTCEGITEE